MPVSKNQQPEGSQLQGRVSQRKESGEDKKTVQPLLTPMIDVTFLLLLYFLLTSTFCRDEGQLPASLPGGASRPGPVVPLRPVRLTVTSDGCSRTGVMYVVDNNRPTNDPRELFSLLEKRASACDPSEQPVIIKSDGFARWEYVVEAYNAALRAKYKCIAFESESQV